MALFEISWDENKGNSVLAMKMETKVWFGLVWFGPDLSGNKCWVEKGLNRHRDRDWTKKVFC